MKRHKRFGHRLFSTLGQTAIWSQCAAVGYYGFLSIFPAMAVFVLIYGIAYSPSQIEAQIQELKGFVPKQIFALLNTHLKDLAALRPSHLNFGLVLSTLTALYAGSLGTRYLINLVHIASNTTPKGTYVFQVLRAIVLTVAVMAVSILSLLAIAGIPLLVTHLPFPKASEALALWARWPILATLVVFSMLTLYFIGGRRATHTVSTLLPGAILATVLWLGLSWGFSYYVQHFANYNATFGALSAGVILMLWIYYSAFVIALGAAVNDALAEMKVAT